MLISGRCDHCKEQEDCCHAEAKAGVQVIPGTGEYWYNYWGYSTVGFFAPMSRFSEAAGAGQPASEVVREFKTLVRECHKRGIEVILDVVFNHTAEGNQNGPSISFRQGSCLSSTSWIAFMTTGC